MTEFWDVLVFLLESVLFVLVGLQLRHLLSAIRTYPAGDIALLGVLTVAGVVIVRMLWWLAIPTLRWRPDKRVLVDTGEVPRPERIALGWSGLRGAISLAAALSIPSVLSNHRFPGRELIVFATFCVIITTLVLQGTTLPLLLRRLGLCGGEFAQRQRSMAERRCSETALRLLDELSATDEIADDVAEMLRTRYERRIERARMIIDADGSAPSSDTMSLRAVEARLLEVQYRVLQELHRQGEITYAVQRAVQRELELEHARLQH